MQPDAPPNRTSPASSQPLRITWRSILFVAASLVLVALGVVIAQVVSKTEQRAENWISGIAAFVAAGNVLLTFYLLRVAQSQLGVLREDLHEQGARHERELKAQEARLTEEADQYRSDLARTHALLTTQTEALALARSDAQRAHQETAKSRLDLIAPRCSIVPDYAKVTLYRHGQDQPEVIDADTELPRDVDNLTLTVSFLFSIRNWGDEPFMYSTGSPISPAGNFLLDPDKVAKFGIEIRHSLRDWINISRGTFDIHRQPVRPERGPAWFDFIVPVTNLSAEINDEHKWGTSVMPLVVEEFRLIAKNGQSVLAGAHRVAIRRRDYIHLRQANSSNEEVADTSQEDT